MTSSHQKRLPPSLLGGGNLASSLGFAAERWPERVAITYEGRAVTAAELEARSGRVAAMLRARGVARGDRVAIQLPNVPAFVYLYFAVLRLGAVVVPMNPLLKGEESAYGLADSEARLLLSWHESDLPAGGGVERVERVSVTAAGEELIAGFEPERATADVSPEETAVILYTSGTTGRPKGAELTHRNLGLNTGAVIESLELVAEDVLLGTLPLYHSFGQTCTLNATVAVGARLALLSRFDPARALELMERERVTVLMGVPTMLFAIATTAESAAPFAALRVCMSGGAPLPLEQGQAFEAVAGLPVIESYGLSETSPAATLHRPDSNRVGSVGRAIEGVEVRILDDDLRELPSGETGQIAIRGHNVMRGYWRRPDATAEAITADGWFLSGDLGRIDEDGYVYVVGRLKDMILRGGLNVYPREVEDVLHSHPSVLEAAVVGMPDERLGEEVGAAVVLAPDAATAPDELRDWIKERVAPYKYPRLIWTLEELPKGPTGGIVGAAIGFWLGRLMASADYRWGLVSGRRLGLEAFVRGYAESHGMRLEDRWRFHSRHRDLPLPGVAGHVLAPGGDGDLFVILGDAAELRSQGVEVAFSATRPLAAVAVVAELPADALERLRRRDRDDDLQVETAATSAAVWRSIPGNLALTTKGCDEFRAAAGALLAEMR